MAVACRGFQINQTYWNPNGNNGAGTIGDWNYNIQRLRERPSYWKVAEHYKGRSLPSSSRTTKTGGGYSEA